MAHEVKLICYVAAKNVALRCFITKNVSVV